MKAFAYMPQYKVFEYQTPPSERIYELRSYESATEAKALKKIHMFNEGGEIAIFEKVGSNAVFYGQVLLGSLKPRLMYMTTYAEMKSHDEHWDAFRNHPDWLTLKALPEYVDEGFRTLEKRLGDDAGPIKPHGRLVTSFTGPLRVSPARSTTGFPQCRSPDCMLAVLRP